MWIPNGKRTSKNFLFLNICASSFLNLYFLPFPSTTGSPLLPELSLMVKICMKTIKLFSNPRATAGIYSPILLRVCECVCVTWISSVRSSAVHWYLCSVLTAWYTRCWHVLPFPFTHKNTHTSMSMGFGVQQCVDNSVVSCHCVCLKPCSSNSPLILLEWPW